MKKRKTIAVLVLILGIVMITFAGYQLMKTTRVTREADESYTAIRTMVHGYLPQKGPSAPIPKIYIPDLEIDYVSLEEINKDAVAWLYCPDTVIDYPVMKTDNYSYYLTHLPDGTYNLNGSLFIDYNNAPDFSDPLTVVYGHHMRSGNMFGTLVGYKEQEYFDKFPFLYLYTEQANYRIDLIYGFVTGAGDWRDRAFMYKENLGSLMAYAEHNTTFESDVSYTQGDRVAALSTCSYEFEDARYVVLGLLRAEY